MTIDATFWVAISFIIFCVGLIYLKVPKKINELLNKLILDIKNEIDESEKLRTEAKVLLDNAQKKLDSAQSEGTKILEQTKKDGDRFQMKEATLKEIKNVSIKIAVDSVKKIINTSIDKSKLDNLFEKNLEETKIALKKINS